MRYLVLRLIFFACFSLISMQGIAQTQLVGVFADLHSSDKNVRAAASSRIIEALRHDIPNLEQDTAVIRSALGDSDPFIRQQASGILNVIAVMYPEHYGMIRECSTALVQIGLDKVEHVRFNAFSALNAVGPPPESQAIFLAALNDPSTTYLGLGTSGLLKLASVDKSNVERIVGALKAAKDDNVKMILLGAVAGAGVSDEHLFGAASDLLYDKEPRVQQVAIQAVAVSAPDKSKVASALQNLAGSSLGSSTIKKQAETEALQLVAR